MLPFDQRALLLLGLLKTQHSHGYQLHEFIERNLSRVADIKKATAYAALDRLCAEGLVEVQHEQHGNRPSRKVYSITPSGSARFEALLRESLRHLDDLRGAHDVAVMFLDELPLPVAIAALEERLAARRAELANLEVHAPRHLALGVSLAVGHVVALARADVAWLEGALVELRRAQDEPKRAGSKPRRAKLNTRR